MQLGRISKKFSFFKKPEMTKGAFVRHLCVTIDLVLKNCNKTSKKYAGDSVSTKVLKFRNLVLIKYTVTS